MIVTILNKKVSPIIKRNKHHTPTPLQYKNNQNVHNINGSKGNTRPLHSKQPSWLTRWVDLHRHIYSPPHHPTYYPPYISPLPPREDLHQIPPHPPPPSLPDYPSPPLPSLCHAGHILKCLEFLQRLPGLDEGRGFRGEGLGFIGFRV